MHVHSQTYIIYVLHNSWPWADIVEGRLCVEMLQLHSLILLHNFCGTAQTGIDRVLRYSTQLLRLGPLAAFMVKGY